MATPSVPSSIICVARGIDEIDSATLHLDETQVQLMYLKFPVGTGTFKRNKFIYVQFIGPKCGAVKRGRGIGEVNVFSQCLEGAAGFSTTDKSCLTFGYLVERMRDVFVQDSSSSTFSIQTIHDEYIRRLAEEKRQMHVDEPSPLQSDIDAAERRLSMTTSSAPDFMNDEFFFAKGGPKPTIVGDMEAAILRAIGDACGPVNWATFAANAKTLTLENYGDGGIFELVKTLNPTKWLFGVFRISIGSGADRQFRVIFFQWMGDELRVVMRERSSMLVYQRLAEVLGPYAMELFFVGKADLNPQRIIDKAVEAFTEPTAANPEDNLRTARSALRKTAPMVSEEEYRRSLNEEMDNVTMEHEFFVVRKKCGPGKRKMLLRENRAPGAQGGSNGNGAGNTVHRTFDVKGTLRLVHQTEGGLSWAIFQVK